MLFDFRGGSLRAELAVTCTRDQTPTSHVDISATTPRFGPQQLRSGRGHKWSTGPAVLAGRPQGDDSESPMAGRSIPVGAETSSTVLPRSGVRLGVERLETVLNDVGGVEQYR